MTYPFAIPVERDMQQNATLTLICGNLINFIKLPQITQISKCEEKQMFVKDSL